MVSMPISSVASLPVAADKSSSSGGVPVVPAASSLVAQKAAITGADVATPAPAPERIAQAVKQVNDAFSQNGQDLYAAIDRDKVTGITVVKVFDKNTKEEVSQFPPKAIIAMADAISQSIEGKVQLMHVSA